jgi:hypothetical protein
MRRPTIGLVAILAALCAVASAAATMRAQHVERASLGPWRAAFTYDEAAGTLPSYSHLRLVVSNGKKQMLDAPIVSKEPGADRPEPASAGQGGSSLFFRDLDGAGAPELVLELYTGGAHCCFVDQVFDFSSSRPLKIELDLADSGARIVTIGGKPLLESADDSFAYEFTDYGDSGSPILLLRYLGGRFEDVTRSHPQLVDADASRWWRASQTTMGHKGDARGVLAAWAADEAVLGQASIAKRTLQSFAAAAKIGGDSGPGWPTGRAYVEKLWRFLAKRGYL